MKGGIVKIPEYVTREEVNRVCKGLRIRDWTKLKRAEVLPKEAKVILAKLNTEKMKIDLEEFRKESKLNLSTEFDLKMPMLQITILS